MSSLLTKQSNQELFSTPLREFRNKTADIVLQVDIMKKGGDFSIWLENEI